MDCARRTRVRKSGVSWTVQDGLTSGSPVFHGLCTMDSRPEVRCFMDCARWTHVRKSGVSWTMQDGLTSGSPVFHGLCKKDSRPEVRCFMDCARWTRVRKSGVSARTRSSSLSHHATTSVSHERQEIARRLSTTCAHLFTGPLRAAESRTANDPTAYRTSLFVRTDNFEARNSNNRRELPQRLTLCSVFTGENETFICL